MRQALLYRLFYDPLFGKLDFDTVLDVGSGNGKMIDYFSSRGKKVTAVDLHPTREGIQKMDFMKNTFKDNQFDLVYSAHMIEHLSDPEKFVEEVLRISSKYV